jgi:2-polyprenyl-3-methyl-5-hydroxy-6-metoxy-1,4-benzoquinol methylase
MEVGETIHREYNPAHPNYERWHRAREISHDRAEFVKKILSTDISLSGLNILDIGAGEGSTSALLSEHNSVFSLEPKPERLKKITTTDSLKPVQADCLNLPFKQESFDLIILQDVIEHLKISEKFINELNILLKEEGLIYLSTPNRLSVFNIISDPHWGLPFLSLFNRKQIKELFIKFFREEDYNRHDIAELLSLDRINKIFGKQFSIMLCTNFSVNHLLNDGKGIIWSNFHLRLVKLVKKLKLDKILLKLSNDKSGIINKFFTPTFYIILKKRKSL